MNPMKKTFLFLLALLPAVLLAYTGQTEKTFRTPGDYPAGLTWDGQHLWVSDFQTDRIYELNTEGKVLRSIASPAYYPMGLAFDGKYLWNSDSKGLIPQGDEYHRGKIYKIDPSNGNILQTLEAPTPSPAGLTWDGRYLWCVDNLHRRLIQFDPEDGTTLREFPSPSSGPTGLTFDGRYLWVSDRLSNQLYRVDPSDGNVILITDAPGPYARDLCWDGKNLWNVDFETKSLYKLKVDHQKYIRFHPSHETIIYRHLSTNFGPGNILRMDVQIALPENRPNQQLQGKFNYSPAVTDIATDQYGQKSAHFVWKNLAPGQKKEAVVQYAITTYDVRYFIYPEEVGTAAEIPDAVREKYLRDAAKYDIHDTVITHAVQRAVGNETNLYWKMRKIFNYVIAHLYYQRVGGWNTAPTVLARGNGSCSEYSFVFIAMCRAAGIPARYVGTIAKRGDDRAIDDVFHRWVEVYLPHYGWIPVDPSGGDQHSPAAQAAHIGFVANRYVITTQSAGGSSTLGWNYNSNETYSTRAKTNVAVDYYGEWLQSTVNR
jgi:sugar lactone lactonase YvrE